MVEMELIRILMNERRGEQMVVLKEKNGKRTLPIVIGIPEASAIKIKISGVKPPRPMTHDLLKDIIEGLGAKLKSILIEKIESNTFFAKLNISDAKGRDIAIDARPSDSIALALRVGCSIFASEELLDQLAAIDKP